MEGQKVVKVFCHEEESHGAASTSVNEALRDSAANANRFANILMPVMSLSWATAATPSCAIAGRDPGRQRRLGRRHPGHAWSSFLSLNKSFTQPITQVSQQVNCVVMAAGRRPADLRPDG